jgi:hypothetical protein
MRTGQHNGKTSRNPANAHIQKAPEEKTNTRYNPEMDMKKVGRKKRIAHIRPPHGIVFFLLQTK